MILIWTQILKFIGHQYGGEDLEEKPDLGFNYDQLVYDLNRPQAQKLIGETKTELTNNEALAVEAFVNSYDWWVWPIDAEEKTYGGIRLSQIQGQQEYAWSPQPLTGIHTIYNRETHNWDFIHGVNQRGEYLGNVPYTECFRVVPDAPPDSHYRWNIGRNEWEWPVADFKAATIEYLQKNKDKLFNGGGGCLFQGYEFSVSDEALARIDQRIRDNQLILEDVDGDQQDFDSLQDLKDLRYQMILIREDTDIKMKHMIEVVKTVNSREEYYNVDWNENTPFG